MRRLAKQSREDKYTTLKDYQVIKEDRTVRISFPEGSALLVLSKDVAVGNTTLLGFAGYFRPSHDSQLKVAIVTNGDTKRAKTFNLARQRWNRVGIVCEHDGESQIRVRLEFEGDLNTVELWGVDLAVLTLPEKVAESRPSPGDLEATHVCPETLYLPHAQVLNLDIVQDVSSKMIIQRVAGTIQVKKCSYCQRMLPIDPKRPGTLGFHKHNAKRTGHQNECRACKKWRINLEFNPLRTVDQLHESSVITRERSLLLREPEILQKIKDRHGEGLKSIIWKRFGKRCFRCGTPITLSDVRIDHTRPLAYLWPIDEYATCLCEGCNNFKKDKFPRDVYTDEELRDLSRITGLTYEELKAKRVNQVELRRIVRDITMFARVWDPRTFNATARKVLELKRDVDLFDVLRRTDESLCREVVEALRLRPE